MKVQIYFLLLICIYSCNSKRSDERYSQEQIASLKIKESNQLHTKVDDIVSIDLNPFVKEKKFSLDHLIQDVNMIPLETSSESIVGDIVKIVFTEGNIFVLDNFKGGSIIIFTSDGLFVRRIPNGAGPGELQRLYDIAFDEKTNELIAYEHSLLTFYDSSGKFIREERLPFGPDNFITLSEGFLFLLSPDGGNEHLDSLKNSKLLITNRNFEVVYSGLKIPNLKCLETKRHLQKGYENNVFITSKCLDTIYEYKSDSNQLKAKYFLDYRDKRISDYGVFDTYQNFENSMRKNDYSFFIGEYFDSQKHHAFILYNWYENFTSVIYRDKTTGNLVGGTSLSFNLNELPPIFTPMEVMKDYFVMWYWPSENDLFASNSTILSEEDKARVKGLGTNDNPVLVFYKLKEF